MFKVKKSGGAPMDAIKVKDFLENRCSRKDKRPYKIRRVAKKD